MAKAIKNNDEVVVISGAYKPSTVDGARRMTTGKVIKVDRDAGRVVVEGVNVRKVARKQRGNEPGGLIEIECPMHISNVMLLERYNERMAKRTGTASTAETPPPEESGDAE